MKILRKKKIYYLFDKKNNWIKNYLFKLLNYKLKKFNHFIVSNLIHIKKPDLVFIIGYTKKIKPEFLKKCPYNFVIHESNLPKGKGFAPIQWQILDNKNKIPVSVININATIDSGDFIIKDYIKFKVNELNDQIRRKQAEKTIELIKKTIRIYPKFKFIRQKGKSTYFQKRKKEDSEININKSIKEQFNLFRIVDNKKYPAFFHYKNKRYILKITQDD